MVSYENCPIKKVTTKTDIFMKEFIKACTQRPGIANGGELYIHPPGAATWLLIKLIINPTPVYKGNNHFHILDLVVGENKQQGKSPSFGNTLLGAVTQPWFVAHETTI